MKSAKNLADHFYGVVVALDESATNDAISFPDADLPEIDADSDLDADLGDVPF